MDRLTHYDVNGVAQITPGYCEAAANMQAIQRLAAYEDAESEGRLIVLPCKVGDVVYVIKHRGISSGDILPMAAKWIETNAYGWCVCCEYPPLATFALKFEDFGKTVFLTRAEAEAALKGVGTE